MAFTSELTTDIRPVGSGERWYPNGTAVLAAREFENGIQAGRIAAMVDGVLSNMTTAATATIAGVPMRKVGTAVESAGTFSTEFYDHVEYVRVGFVTVDVADGEEPAIFDTVAVNDDGEALVSGSDGATDIDAEFIEEITSGVWLIRLK